MRNLLCWCIWLWAVGSVGWGQEAGDWGLEKTRPQPAPISPSLIPNPQSLPCLSSAPTCLETLGDLAVQNSRELAVLKQAVQLQKKKLWTAWLNADGLHPLAIGLRIARNIAGGGDRAAAQLEITRLELRQAELESQLRQAITRAALEIETAQQQKQEAEHKLTLHRARISLFVVAYRVGEGSTEMMLQLWHTETELQHAVERAHGHWQQTQQQLRTLVFPNWIQ